MTTTRGGSPNCQYDDILPHQPPLHGKSPDREGAALGFSTDSLAVTSIEIFNLAGEKVRTLLAGRDINFVTENNVSLNSSDMWWDMRNESGQEVASGTYWAKVNAELRAATTLSRQVNFIRKFVIVR